MVYVGSLDLAVSGNELSAVHRVLTVYFLIMKEEVLISSLVILGKESEFQICSHGLMLPVFVWMLGG